jgi:hypothetical protein
MDREATNVADPFAPHPIELSQWTTLFEAVNARVAEIVSRMANETCGPHELQCNNVGREALLECAEAWGQLRTMFPVSDPELIRAQRDLIDVRITFANAQAALRERASGALYREERSPEVQMS